jgi:hypothetical protein
MRNSKTLVLLAIVLSAAFPLLASLTGDIQGTVFDPTGLVVADAAITIRNLATGTALELKTNSLGEFAALQLAIGIYNVRVELKGFRTYEAKAEVRSGETTRLNITLQLGSTTEVVTVETSVGPALDVASAQLSSSLDSKTLATLPLIGRDPATLSGLAPGVIPVTPNNPFLGSGSYNSNGQRGRANNITIDNVTSTDIATTGTSGFGTLSLDAIAEFKLITNNFSAEFGRNAGSQLQLITKRGTNEYHGTAYWFHRNAALNARDFFDRTGKATPFINNVWGFTAGGPILKNRTFVFGTYEGLRTRGAGDTRTATVLTPAQVARITDPTSNAVFTALGSPQSASGQLTNSAPNLINSAAWSLRVDQQFRGGKDTLTGRYGAQRSTSATPGLTFIETNLPNYGATALSGPRQFTASETHSFSPAVVNQFRFHFGRTSPQFFPNTTLRPPFAPEVRITGFANMGVSRLLFQGRVLNTFEYSDSFSWARGRHSFKFGVDVFRYQSNDVFDANFRGIASFASVADFQAGNLLQWVQNIGTSRRAFRETDIFFYVQDDFRITPTLTLNIGARVESSGGPSEVHNILSNLDLNKPGPIGGAGPGALGSFDLGGTAFPRNWNPAPRIGLAWNPHNGKFVVRAGYGWAYDYIFLNPITNLRFSAPFVIGISPTTQPPSVWASLVAGTSTFQQQAQATVGTFNPAFTNFGAISPVNQNLENPRASQWNFGFEYEFLQQFVFKTTYTGTKGDFLQVSRQINFVAPGVAPPSATSEADEFNRRAAFSATFGGESAPATSSSNRIDPRLNGVTLVDNSGSSIYHALEVELLKRASHGYSFGAAYTYGHSIDNVSDVLGVLVNDSPNFQDPRNLSNNRGNSQFDIRHRFVINHTFEPPWTRRFTGVAGRILDGWGFSGIFSIQSGFPVTIFAGTRRGITDILLAGASNVRANFSGGSFTPVLQGSPAAALIPSLCARGVVTSLNGAVCTNTSNFPFTQPLLGNIGNMGRNLLRLNKFQDFDWAFYKNTKITERHALQFRLEMFNVFNHPIFSRFVNTLSSPDFGKYQGTDIDTRRMQVALKYIF